MHRVPCPKKIHAMVGAVGRVVAKVDREHEDAPGKGRVRRDAKPTEASLNPCVRRDRDDAEREGEDELTHSRAQAGDGVVQPILRVAASCIEAEFEADEREEDWDCERDVAIVHRALNSTPASCRARPVSANECGVYPEQYRSVGEFTRSPIAHHNPTRASRIIDPDRNAVESVRLKNALGSPDGSEQLAELHRARSNVATANPLGRSAHSGRSPPATSSISPRIECVAASFALASSAQASPVHRSSERREAGAMPARPPPL